MISCLGFEHDCLKEKQWSHEEQHAVCRAPTRLLEQLTDLSFSDLELEWLLPVPGGVDLLAVGERERVVAGDALPALGEGRVVALGHGIDVHAHDAEIVIGAEEEGPEERAGDNEVDEEDAEVTEAK